MIEAPVLEMRGVSKAFPGVRALHAVDLVVGRGEVVAVVGENGAGKSTLMKVLAGVHVPDAGEVRVDGRVVPPGSPAAALEAGVALVHQELSLCDNLDVAGNVFLGREPRRAGLLLDRARMRRETDAVLRTLGADFDATVPVATLSLGQRQLVEVAKALTLDARVVVLDEPTSSLTAAEAGRLFAVVRALQARGVGVVYISHRLAEVRALADAVVVLRDGEVSGVVRGRAASEDELVRLMVGREVVVAARAGVRADAPVALELRGLATAAFPGERVSLEVHAGECVGLAGLVGAGRTELLRAVFGVEPPVAGEVRVHGRRVELGHPRDALRAGLALVPEDRKALALLLADSVRANVTLAALPAHARAGWVEPGWEARAARGAMERLAIRASGPDVAVGTLSGGNQQKVVLARWLELGPRVLLLDEPTRGVDVGARQELYALLERLCAEGVAVLFASSELEEVLTLADRVVVLRAGRAVGVLARAELSEEAVMALATGAAPAPVGAYGGGDA